MRPAAFGGVEQIRENADDTESTGHGLADIEIGLYTKGAAASSLPPLLLPHWHLGDQ
jgi:hypothetical protein